MGFESRDNEETSPNKDKATEINHVRSTTVDLIDGSTLGGVLKIRVVVKEKWIFYLTQHLIRQNLKGDPGDAKLGKLSGK